MRDSGGSSAVVLVVGMLVAGCSTANTGAPAPSPSSMSPLESTAPSAEVSASPSMRAVSSPRPTAPATELAVGGIATVVADSVVVRTEPGRQSDFVIQPCTGDGGPCRNLLIGPDTGYTTLYLMDGPVQADGYEWFLAAIASPGSSYPEYAGWIPTGDSAGPWVVPTEAQCPEEPIDLEDVVYAKPQLDLLACVGDRELTLTGWLPAPPADSASEECVPLEGREEFCSFGGTILRTEVGEWAGDVSNARPWIGETASRLSAPPYDAWVTIRGSFDHPASADCFTDGYPIAVILCQLDFVVTSISTP